MDKSAEDFYREVLEILLRYKIHFLIGGTYAIMKYTGIVRETKDLDIFCKAGDYPHIIRLFSDLGYQTYIKDERWIVKIVYKNYYVDVIFNSNMGVFPVDDSWFKNAPVVRMFGLRVKLIPPDELFWSKAFRMGRSRFEGPDINHLILKKGKDMNWKHVLMRMEAYWEILLAHILMFRFVYPSKRTIIPRWLMKELTSRVMHQLSIGAPNEIVCRGSLLSLTQYKIDITRWGFLDITQR